MEPTWKEYQNALNIVKAFDDKRRAVQSKRKTFNWQRTFNDIVWHKRMELAKERLEIEKLPKELQESNREFFAKQDRHMYIELLRIRFEAQEWNKKQKDSTTVLS